MAPPASKSDSKSPGSALKPVLYAEAYKGQVKLRVSEFDYPPGTTEKELSAFLDRVRGGYQSHAFGMVSEAPQANGAVPAVELDAKFRGWTSMRARAFFCDKRAYLVELGGADEYQKEAELCWSGISIIGEPPLNAATFSRLTDIRSQLQAEMLARSTPPSRAGTYIIEIAGVLVAVMGLLWIAMKVADKLRAGGFKFHRKRRRRRRHSTPTVPIPSASRSHQ